MTKHDIVYFVKDAPHNEELRYSLRSVVANFPFRKIWIIGFCPYELNADQIVGVDQRYGSKWSNTKELMRKACAMEDMTPDFWLFNDDFFVMKPVTELPPLYEGTLETRILDIESRHSDKPTQYTAELRRLLKTLKQNGLGTLNYAVHKPMLINRAKMSQTLAKFPNEKMLRALYGNHHAIGGEPTTDYKAAGLNRIDFKDKTFISTDDAAFELGEIGKFIREQFPNPSKYEV